ncbi:hypothetical protein D3C81_1136390 [compost metagenome]
MLLLHAFDQAWDADRADGAAAGAGARHGRIRVGGVVDIAQIVLGGGGGRRFPAIVGLHGARAGVVVEHEAARAHAGGFRHGQPQHGLYGHRGIRRAAAFLEHRAAGRAGIGVRRRHHVGLRIDRLEPRTVAGRWLGQGRVAGLARSHHDRAAVVGQYLATGVGLWGGRRGGGCGWLVIAAAARSDQQGTGNGNGGGQRQRGFLNVQHDLSSKTTT